MEFVAKIIGYDQRANEGLRNLSSFLDTPVKKEQKLQVSHGHDLVRES